MSVGERRNVVRHPLREPLHRLDQDGSKRRASPREVLDHELDQLIRHPRDEVAFPVVAKAEGDFSEYALELQVAGRPHCVEQQ